MNVVIFLVTLAFEVISVCCKDFKVLQSSRLSCSEAQELLDYHNDRRNFVAEGSVEGQPHAADMMELVWSRDLATVAHDYAKNCVFEHSTSKTLGENIARTWSIVNERTLPVKMAKLWFDEVYQHGYKMEYNPMSGHYSQMIWANTREVGCGYSFYKQMYKPRGKMRYYSLLVCNYYPPGNIHGRKAYTSGPSDCETFSLYNSTKYPNLCSRTPSYEDLCALEQKESPKEPRPKKAAPKKWRPQDKQQPTQLLQALKKMYRSIFPCIIG